MSESDAPPPRRRYDASGRRRAAEERRMNVSAVAAQLFAERGWTGTTIAAVAEQAGVSAEMVQSVFGGKAGLFIAAFRAASFNDHPTLQEAFGALKLDNEPDRLLRLDEAVAFCCRSLIPMAPLVPVLHQAAASDADVRRLLQAADVVHYETVREMVRQLAPGPVGEDTVDEVCVLTLAETYLAFIERRGWTLERYAGWLRRTLAAAVGLPLGEAS